VTRYLIAGANGQLGHDLQKALAGRDVAAFGHAELDVTDLQAVREASRGYDVILNASAYNKVDEAEEQESVAHAVNATGAQNLAIAASEVRAKLIHVSTDYVFDGTARSPYSENAMRSPISAYGRTKAEGERLALEANPERTYVVRTAWLYGSGGTNFAKTMVKLAASHDTVSVVDDQRGQPTWTGDLAVQIVALLDADAPTGIYHGTNSGETTWFGFAQAIFTEAGLDPARVLPTTSAEFVRPAPRPNYSVLGHDAWTAAGLAPMRGWREALADAAGAGAITP